MIKPGTLCIVVDATPEFSVYLGRICTVTGPLCIARNAYPTDIVSPKGRHMYATRMCLKPIDDPNQFAADPAWTKRTEPIHE